MMQTLDFGNVTNASHEGEGDFEDPLKEAYGFSYKDKSDLWDMATGEYFRPGCVIAAHIFQYRWRRYLSTFSGLTNIHDVRNGLFLYMPVEWAFNRAKLFIQVNKTGALTFRLLDQGLRDVKLADKASELVRMEGERERAPVGRGVTHQTTFGDLDGQDVHFPPNSKMRPSKRLLALHAYATWLTFTGLNPDSQVAAPVYNFNVSEDGLGSTADAFNIIDEWKKNLSAL
jgi:hypothetical protein